MGYREPFVTGEKYHIYNRGTEKRKVFLDKNDYQRFLFVLSSMNRATSHGNIQKGLRRMQAEKIRTPQKEHSPLVAVSDYCLMPNHYHLIVEQMVDNGIAKFLQKVMTSYTMYFNKKYERNGVLFQGKTKSKFITSDLHYKQVKTYLDLNPVDLCEAGWREHGKVADLKKVTKFLGSYAWSSCEGYESYLKYLSGKERLGLLDWND